MKYQSGSTHGLHSTYIPSYLAAFVMFKMASSFGVVPFLTYMGPGSSTDR